MIMKSIASVLMTASFAVLSFGALAEEQGRELGKEQGEKQAAQAVAISKNFHDFTFESIERAEMPFDQYKGKVVMVVNTASFCGFTPQYKGLQKLWEDNKDDGFVVLGVPANDFGSQEPGSEETIKKFCEVNYKVDFPMTRKMVVDGREGTSALYSWLAEEMGEKSRPKWNFHKYIINKEGQPVAFFESKVTPQDDKIVGLIDALLKE